MAEVKWIKLFVDIWDNRKIRQIETLPDGDTVLVIWLKLLTLAGNINDGGLVYFTRDIPYTDTMLAAQIKRPLNTVQMALDVFQRFGMIEIVNDMMLVTNWEKYQSLEKMEIIREQNRIRKQNERERKRLETVTRDVTQDVTLMSRDVTQQNKNKIKNKNKEKEKRKRKKKDFIAADEMMVDDVDLDELKERMFENGNSTNHLCRN